MTTRSRLDRGRLSTFALGGTLWTVGLAWPAAVVGVPVAAAGAVLLVRAGRAYAAEPALRRELDALRRRADNAAERYRALNVYTANLERRLRDVHSHPSTQDPDA